jgi:hypothetical protein
VLVRNFCKVQQEILNLLLSNSRDWLGAEVVNGNLPRDAKSRQRAQLPPAFPLHAFGRSGKVIRLARNQ